MNKYLLNEIYKEIIGTNVIIEDGAEVVEVQVAQKNPVTPNNIIDNEFLNHAYIRCVFINTISTWKNLFTNQENINEVFGIDLLSYNEDIYSLFRSLLFPLFGENESLISLISWYICDREYINDEGKMICLPIINEKNEEVDVSTPALFYDYLIYLSTYENINLIEYDNNPDGDEDDDMDDEDED